MNWYILVICLALAIDPVLGGFWSTMLDLSRLVVNTPRRIANDTRPECACNRPHHSRVPRVVGGRNAKKTAFPYDVGLMLRLGRSDFTIGKKLKAYCGGILITDTHVITAAHCVRERAPEDLRLNIGDYNLSDTHETESYIRPIVSITKHPDYKAPSFNNDIAVLKLQEPVPLKGNLHTVMLPPQGSNVAPGTSVVVTGWGRLTYGGYARPDVLQEVPLPVVTKKDCQDHLYTNITDNMICAGGIAGKDACLGDSGGGLFMQVKNDYVLVGVVSFGKRCALPHVAGVYTRVGNYVEWLYQNTMDAGCRPCVMAQQDYPTFQ